MYLHKYLFSDWVDESGFIFPFHFLSSNASLYLCWSWTSSCRTCALGMLLDVIRISWYSSQNTPSELSQTARLAGIQIRCYLGSWFKMAQNEKNKITFPYITGIDQKTIKDNSTCKLPKWYIFVWAKSQWGVYKLMSWPGTSILNWKDK